MATVLDASAPLTLSDSAARRVAHLIAMEKNPALKLRLTVSGGGCSGFQYGFSLDEQIQPEDTVISDKGVTVLIDDMSLLYVTGTEIDFVEDLAGASFQLHNPNASSSCGCGTSFAI